jgi:hypothetical protein
MFDAEAGRAEVGSRNARALAQRRRQLARYSANGKLSCPTARIPNTFSVMATNA